MEHAMQNKYAGRCDGCGERVEAGAGEIRKVGSRWAITCVECKGGRKSSRTKGTAVAVAETPAPAIVSDETYTLLSGHAASAYQAAVFDHFRYGRDSALVRAVAGAGKTTTIKNAMRYLPERAHVQLFAFNVEAAAQLKTAIEELEEADERSYANVKAGTFHSVGYSAVRRFLNLPKEQLKVDAGKCRKLLRDHLGDSDEGKRRMSLYGAFVTHLVGLAKGEGVGALVPDLDGEWHALINHHGLYLDAEEASVRDAIALARKLLDLSNEAARQGFLDYDDMIYLPCLWKLRLWRNDVVVCDEAQDTNPVRRAMLHMALRDGGKLYAVGDERQSIYGFTGASTDAMELIAREFNARDLPLTVCYRCASSIVERAQAWVRHIEPAPDAPQGEVRDNVPLADALALLGPSDAILCRQTAPLVSVAYALIARGRACHIAGREIGEGLVNLIEGQKARGINRLMEKLTVWRDREVARFLARGEETRAEGVSDRFDCIEVLVGALPQDERTVPALIARVRSLFDDTDRGRLLLSTVHKAKGREWPTVAILRPELMPSRAARQEWQVAQEMNLCYVAATRARDRLIYVRDGDMEVEARRLVTASTPIAIEFETESAQWTTGSQHDPLAGA
jgi:ATP-dependent DNA helicase UvrD/PcrA